MGTINRWCRHYGAACSMLSMLGVLVASFGIAPGVAFAEAPGCALYPTEIRLSSADDLQTVVVMDVGNDGITRDRTADAAMRIDPPDLADVRDGVITPRKNGSGTLFVTVEGRESSTSIEVSGVEALRPLSFRLDVEPVFMKAGCNTGACHGSAQGKNGFRLSLFGFEPDKDYLSLTRDFSSRRIDVAVPQRSLLLRKPTAEIAHEGGRKFEPGSPLYNTLLEWIRAGTPDDNVAAIPRLTGIEVLPRQIVVRGSGHTQRLTVRASYSDGTDRDVTTLTLFDTLNDATATVNSGAVTSASPGEAFIMARFGTFAEVVQVIVRRDDPSFVWPSPPSANEIDDAIYKKLQLLEVPPSPVCSDEIFVRRVYLDTVGVLPTPEEYAAFIADTSADKRSRLIDTLLDRPEFPELWAMKWAELLRIESGTRRISFKAMYLYNQWLRDAVLSNMPLNEMVRTLLTAEGGNFSTPVANFYMVESDPALMAENVAQVFTGIRIQCAQCHNHPFERWTQDDYYGFASFFPQIGRKASNDPRETIVFNSGGGEVRHLRDNRVMVPQVLGGQPQMPQGDRRVALAEWLTAPENPYFAACFVDRVFAHFMGRGIVDPPDDVRVSNPPSHPELRQALARRFVETNYDVRGLVRLICNSSTYQRTAESIPENAHDNRNFSHAMVRRLPAEVLLDAVCSVTGVDEKFSGLPLGARAVQVADAASGSYFLDVFGRPPRTSVCTCERSNEPTLSQALHLINGDTLTRKIGNAKGRLHLSIKAKRAPADIIDELYVAALMRHPTESEAKTLLDAVGSAPDITVALEDLYWAVLNSTEFVFNH